MELQDKTKHTLMISSEFAVGFILLYTTFLHIRGLSATRPEAVITGMVAGFIIMGGIVSFLLIRAMDKILTKKGE
jgi:uncharacterized membrane protein YecN with MAPEG domain